MLPLSLPVPLSGPSLCLSLQKAGSSQHDRACILLLCTATISGICLNNRATVLLQAGADETMTHGSTIAYIHGRAVLPFRACRSHTSHEHAPCNTSELSPPHI